MKTTKPKAYSMRLLSGLWGIGIACIGFAISMHYPVAQPIVSVAFAVAAVLFFLVPVAWLVVLPALLPLVGFAPWTGWLTFEELDLIVLGAAAGGYGRLAFQPQDARQQESSLPAKVLIALFVGSAGLAMFRGFTDAGGFAFGWFQGFHEPMNSVRIGKSFVLALIMLPLWAAAQRANPDKAQRLLSLGVMLGLAGAALATVWERTAFTGLLDFTSDYRTTALFWEMHVGGAALDGFLALTVPFALRELTAARSHMRSGLAATVLVLAAYACLTTFSRGVYLAVPVGVALFFVLSRLHGTPQLPRNEVASKQHNVSTRQLTTWHSMLVAVLLVAGFGAGAAWMFQSSGYRGMAALLAAMALMLPLAGFMRLFKSGQWVAGLGLSIALVLLASGLATVLPKGAYVVWGLATVLTLCAIIFLRKSTKPPSITGPLAFAGFVTTLAGVALVANHWGDQAGLWHAAPVVLAVLAVAVVAGARQVPLWPANLGWQMSLTGFMALAAIAVGIFGGGAYMGGRFATGEQDLAARFKHWKLGRHMLQTPAEWWLGKGFGRFPATYFMLGKPLEHTGDYRLKQDGENAYLTLTGGLHVNGWGEIFRMSQRVSVPGKAPVVAVRVRAAKDIGLHFEVCEKHLLYGQNCLTKQLGIKGKPGVWQELQVVLQGDGASRGSWYAPRLLMFSMAMESRGGVADIDHVALTSADGRQLLVNGDFSNNLAHWFFTSDKHHMPWHIKSMPMNVMFEQGVVGLALWCLLMGGALWRVSMGSARQHPLAPALAASMVGFFVVGLFDSLLDVPRLAWLFYLLVLMALALPPLRLQRSKS